MKYTTKQFRVDGDAQHIEVFQDIEFISLYSTLVDIWWSYTGFCKIPFPGPITDMFPVTPGTLIPAGREFKW